MKIAKRIGIAFLLVIILLLVIFGAYYCYLAINYYRIPDKQHLKVGNNQPQELAVGKSYRATTYNVGFGAYNHDFDFFIDSGQLKNGQKLHGKRGTAISKAAVL